jgi:hypothetical protein
MLVISFVPVPSFQGYSSLFGVLSEKTLVLIDDCLYAELSKILCFLSNKPSKSIFRPLIASYFCKDSFTRRLVLL